MRTSRVAELSNSSHGVFLCGTIVLKSGVALDITKDATLLGSTHQVDYRKNRWLALIKARASIGLELPAREPSMARAPRWQRM